MARSRERSRARGRQRVRSPHSGTQYYEDVGTTLSPEQYEKWKSGEASYYTGVEEAESALSKYKGEMDASQAAVDKWHDETGGSKEAWVAKAWAKFRDEDPSMISANLKDKEGNIVKTYKVHKAALDDFHKKYGPSIGDPLDTTPEEEYNKRFGEDFSEKLSPFSYKDKSGGYTYVEGMGVPWHRLERELLGREMGSEKGWKEGVEPQISSQWDTVQPQISSAQSALADAQTQYDLGQKNLEAQKAMKEGGDVNVKQRYLDRLASMEQLFGGLKIERK